MVKSSLPVLKNAIKQFGQDIKTIDVNPMLELCDELEEEIKDLQEQAFEAKIRYDVCWDLLLKILEIKRQDY